MSKKPADKDSRITRKAVFIGAVIGVVVTPILFTLISLGSEFTSERITWLCVNSLCVGAMVGGGIGYLLTSKGITF